LFKDSVPPSALPTTAQIPLTGLASGLAREALTHYQRAVERLKAGDWSGFGSELDALRPLLEQLNRQATSP